MRTRLPAVFASLLLCAPAFAEEPSGAPACRTTPGISPPALSDAPQAEKYFPAISQILGEEGDVQLEFMIGANGRIADPRVEKSSGFPRLDAAALQVVQLWRYKPATRDGERVACANKAIVKWKLSGEGSPSPSRMIVPDASSWPSGTREEAVEGVTIVRADVAPDGKVKTQVTQSSGSRSLDRDAVARVLARPEVKPDMFDGKPVGARFTFYVIWSLTPVALPGKRPVATAPPQGL